MKIVRGDVDLLVRFLARAGRSLETFRYFAKRDTSVLQAHLVTLIGLDEQDRPVAYGHLDVEDGVTWLGICVAEGSVGQGFGRVMMQALVEHADKVKQEVCLSVDKTNHPARKLYEQFEFKVLKSDGDTVYMKRAIRWIP